MRNSITTIFIAALLCLVNTTAEARGGEGGTGQRYAWASRAVEGQFWGMVQGDIDADGTPDTVLMERDRIHIGVLGGKGFDETFSCGWSTAARAARVYLYDTNGDGDLEAVVSAVEEGLPSSLILDVDVAAGRCSEIVSSARFSMRVIEIPADGGRWGKKLVGQGWSRAEFFSGDVRELTLAGKKLKGGTKLKLPWNTSLYDFAPLPEVEGRPAVVILKGPSHMEVKVNSRGRKWRRVWRAGERLGGSANILPAVQRQALDQMGSDYALFNIPPLTHGSDLMAVKADMPTRDVVGAEPYVRGGEAVGFVPDPALTFVCGMRTQWLPGAVVDFVVGKTAGDPEENLLLLLQEDTSAFGKSLQAKVIAFELKDPHSIKRH